MGLVLVASACSRDRKARERKAAQTAPATTTTPGEAPARPQALTLPVEAPARPPSEARAGGTLRVHLDGEPPHLNPLLDSQQNVMRVVTGLVYEPLVECRGGRYLPALAESWEISSDGLRILLKLRSGVRWHDEQAFSVVDVQATLEAVLRSNTRVPTWRAFLSDVAAVELAADRTVRLRLHRPAPIVLRALCEIPIVPERLVRGERPEVAQLGRQPIGTGPFRFAGWERGRRIRLARHGQAWRSANHLDEIVFEIDGDGTRALGRVRRGDIDVLPRVLDAHYPDQVIPAALGDRVQLYRLEPARYSFLAINHRRPPLDDVRFRRALSSLWNRHRFATDVHRGLVRPIAAPPLPGAPDPPPFDLTASTRALEAGGYVDTNGDGVRDRNGAPIKLTFVHATGARALAAESKRFAADMRRAGLLLELVPVDGAAYFDRLRRGDFDLAPMMWEGKVDDDLRPLFGVGGEFNVGGYRSDAVEALLAQVREALDPAARTRIGPRLARALADDVPVLFMYRHDLPVLVSKRVHGLAADGGELDLREVWLDP